MKMFNIYTTSFYGSCLWNIFNGSCDKLFTAWNIAVRMAFDIPRNTHKFLIEEISECPHPQVMLAKRFLKFDETLQKSKKFGIRFLRELSSSNLVTNYGQNLWNIRRKCDNVVNSGNLYKKMKYAPVPDLEKWKVDVVKDLIEVKWNLSEIENLEIDNEEIDDLLKIVCSS